MLAYHLIENHTAPGHNQRTALLMNSLLGEIS